MRRVTFHELDERTAICPCGSGKPWNECQPDSPLAACVDCGRPYHMASNASKRCGHAPAGIGCAGVRRRELEAKRKRDARKAAAANGRPLE